MTQQERNLTNPECGPMYRWMTSFLQQFQSLKKKWGALDCKRLKRLSNVVSGPCLDSDSKKPTVKDIFETMEKLEYGDIKNKDRYQETIINFVTQLTEWCPPKDISTP